MFDCFRSSKFLCCTLLLAGFPSLGKTAADVFTPLPAGNTKLGGHIGQRLDTMLKARYTSNFAQREIYPETAEALRQRVDDTIYRGVGLWQGEFWGKWMLGAIAAQRYTGDATLKDFIRKAVHEVLATQDASGYIGTYAKTDTTRRWNIWCMKYTLWGLVEAYDLLGEPEILAAARRHTDYLMTFVGPGKTEISKTGDFAGYPSCSILQPLMLLYRQTGEMRYLDYAKYVAGQIPGVMTKGLQGEPIHTWFPHPEKWAKAYEFMHCVEGLLDLHRVTGNADYLRAAENIATDIAEHERTIVGNVALDDKLNHARLQPAAYSEVCDAVYYARLCAHLLRLTGKVTYAHEMERTLYNSLCGSMNAEGSWGVRRLALKAPHFVSAKHCWLEHQQCCVANAPRAFLQMAEYAVMTAHQGVEINLYLPGTFKSTLPSGTGLELVTQTDYPVNGTVNIGVNPVHAEKFSIALRIPDWSKQTRLKVNDAPVENLKPGDYFSLNRTWTAGDRIELELDMRGRMTHFPDTKQPFVAVERGPMVLAQSSLLPNTDLKAPVALAADKDGYVSLQTRPAPKGFWMAFDAPLVGGGTITLCAYSSVGEVYKQQIADYYGPPKPDKPRCVVPLPGSSAPTGQEDFQVWLPVKSASGAAGW
ncbi:MAG: hypothetical protein EPN23_08255 [Verrucomicrobia bacterium]|nr:MAG: hypothetical protein EPN23_08255 [Verrucomicrobiota bacterium]